MPNSLRLSLIGLALIGCANTNASESTYNGELPGYLISAAVNGENFVYMEPSFIGDGNSLLRLGLKWEEGFQKDHFMLVTQWSEPIKFSPREEIVVNTDRLIHHLLPVDKSNVGEVSDRMLIMPSDSIPPRLVTVTIKRYWITREDLQSIANSVHVGMVVTFDKFYSDEPVEPTRHAKSEYSCALKEWAKNNINAFLKKVDDSQPIAF